MTQAINTGPSKSKMKKFWLIILILVFALSSWPLSARQKLGIKTTQAQETSESGDLIFTPDPDDPYDILTDEPQDYPAADFGEESGEIGQKIAQVNAISETADTVIEEITQLDKQKIALAPYDEQELFKYWQVYKAMQTNSADLEYYKKNGQPPQNILDELGIDQLQPYDIRIIRLLNYLVKPKDQGGAGHEFIRAKRIRSGYKSEKKATSRESDFEAEESPNISAHFSGQAVDISEIDLLKCTLLKRRHIGTRRIKQPGKPIKVAWQTEEGAGAEMPFGQSFHDLASLLGPGELNDILGPGGKIRANTFQNIIWYIGKTRLEEELNLPQGTLDNSTEKTIWHNIAYGLLAQDMGINLGRTYNIGAYSSFAETASTEELYARLALNLLEDDLDLPRGSLDLNAIKSTNDVNDFYQLLKNIGKRRAEKDLGLIPGFLSEENIDWGLVRDRVGQKQGIYRATDEALGWPTVADGANNSSTQRLLNKDEKVYYVMGALALARALNFERSEEITLLRGVETGQTNLNIHFRNRTFSFAITLEQLEAIFSPNQKNEDKTEEDAYVAKHMPERERLFKEAFGEDVRINVVIRGQMEQYLREEYRQKKAVERNERQKNRKEALENAGEALLNQALNQHSKNIPETVREATRILLNRPLGAIIQVSDLLNLFKNHKLDELLVLTATRQMEQTVGLPDRSLEYTYLRDKNPERLVENIGEARLNEVLIQNNVKNLSELWDKYKSDMALDRLFLFIDAETYQWRNNQITEDQYKQKIGQRHLERKVVSEVALLFDFNLRLGTYQITADDIVQLLHGQLSMGALSAILKIGVKYAEGELELPADFLMNIVSGASPAEAIWISGGQRMARAFGLANLDIKNANSVADFRQVLGREKVEETLALKKDSFKDSFDKVVEENGLVKSALTFGWTPEQTIFVDKIMEQKIEAFKIAHEGKAPNNLEYRGLQREANDEYQKLVAQAPQIRSRLDRLFALNAGETERLIKKEITPEDYNNHASNEMVKEEALSRLDIGQILGLDDRYEIKGNELYKAIRDNDWTKLKNNLLAKGAGLTIDNILKIDPGTTERILATNNSNEQTRILIEQGAKKFAQMLGLPDEDTLIAAYLEGQLNVVAPNSNQPSFRQRLDERLAALTHLPYDAQNRANPVNNDVAAFTDGRLGQALTLWGLANFADQNKDAWRQTGMNDRDSLTAAYNDARMALYGDRNFNLAAPGPESDFVNTQVAQVGSEADFEESPIMRQRRDEVVRVARREFRSQQLRNVSYRLITYKLQQIDPRIPNNFAQIMLEGTDEQRRDLLVNYLGRYAAAELVGLGLTGEQANLLVNALQQRDINALQAAVVIFNWLDAQFSEHVFGQKLPPGTFRAILTYAFTGNPGQLRQVYEKWATDLSFNWLDNKWFNNELGTAREIYQTYKTYKDAYNAYQTAKAAGDATQIFKASQNYNNVRADAYARVVTRVFRKQFQQVDKQLSLPPGTTGLIVSYLMTGNPIYLGMAVYSAVFGVYRVEMYCATADYPKYGGRYFDGRYPSEVEEPGEPGIFNALKETEYRQGLLNASRWKIKKLLESLVAVKEKKQPDLKPTQVITGRQENIEEVASRLPALYPGWRGETACASGQPFVGFCPNPKIWQWVHIGY